MAIIYNKTGIILRSKKSKETVFHNYTTIFENFQIKHFQLKHVNYKIENNF